MKIAFVIGHTKFRKGAYSDYLKSYEYDLYKKHEEKIKVYGDVFYHNPLILSYSKRQKDTAKKTKGYDLVVELHFNAANGSANGCEALYYYNNLETREISDLFCSEYTSLTETRNRGSKPLKDSTQRGFGFLSAQKPNAIILEPFFGDNWKDSLSFDINIMLIALNTAISKYLQYVN